MKQMMKPYAALKCLKHFSKPRGIVCINTNGEGIENYYTWGRKTGNRPKFELVKEMAQQLARAQIVAASKYLFFAIRPKKLQPKRITYYVFGNEFSCKMAVKYQVFQIYT